jgi:uncharacterized protein YggU (UPF0235/DUF167 family)
MKITVHVKPQSRKECVEKLSDGIYKVWVHESAIENRANQAVIKALSAHFKIPKSLVVLSKGSKGKHKIFEIA